jgi:hypothetical protein
MRRIAPWSAAAMLLAAGCNNDAGPGIAPAPSEADKAATAPPAPPVRGDVAPPKVKLGGGLGVDIKQPGSKG